MEWIFKESAIVSSSPNFSFFASLCSNQRSNLPFKSPINLERVNNTLSNEEIAWMINSNKYFS